jgi:hypothetical protein
MTRQKIYELQDQLKTALSEFLLERGWSDLGNGLWEKRLPSGQTPEVTADGALNIQDELDSGERS